MATEVSDVVFDFCGVLIDWQLRSCLLGHYPQQLIDEIAAPNDPYGFFHYEDRMDAGEDLADVIDDYRQRYGDDMAQVFAYYIKHYDDSLTRIVPGMEELLEDLLAAGIGCWGLTNWAHETFHFAFEKFPQLEDLLGGTIVSGAEKMHKPDAHIYQLAMSRYDLDPATTAFFDDTPKNVSGAEAVGMQAFLFSDAAQARRDLESLGVRL
ncbi:HAD family hydrolase [Bifidobacterium aemilianum]|uniref:HAD family hydrolase n=1 Tax=Bifidobacterium aemilianum TaxID=2493120 RepID=A0A366K999_9BIFI|nr:HAD family phosphatase [Bifidobacterium aemilianum]RBP98264.1 HAD family hydrolase [Bifidobacterium aemilianum]